MNFSSVLGPGSYSLVQHCSSVYTLQSWVMLTIATALNAITTRPNFVAGVLSALLFVLGGCGSAWSFHLSHQESLGTSRLSCHAKLCLWLWSMLRAELATF